MSPLLRDELRIVLCPGAVLATRMRRAITLRGLRRQPVFSKRLACDAAAAGDLPWAPAIAKLAEQMPALAGGRVVGTAVVSNHFMRYTVVPWSEALTDGLEQAAYARHCFKENYGYASDTWQLCVNPGRPGMPRIASAIDTRLLDALRAVFQDAGLPLTSIQPQLMATYNACRPALVEGPGWLVTHEPGKLCIAWLDDTGCAWVKTTRVGPDWIGELPRLLKREACLAEPASGVATVYLWAPELGWAATPRCAGFKIHNVTAPTPTGFADDHAPRSLEAESP